MKPEERLAGRPRGWRASFAVVRLNNGAERFSKIAVISVWIDPSTMSPPGTRSASAESASTTACNDEQNGCKSRRLKYWNSSSTTT